MAFSPYRGKWIDWSEVAAAVEIAEATLKSARHQLQPIFDALSRAVAMEDAQPVRAPVMMPRSKQEQPAVALERPRFRCGPAPKSIVEFPEPFTNEWTDIDDFGAALNMHMRRHVDTIRHLYLALASRGEAQDRRTLMKWRTGQLLPRTVRSFVVLNNIEHRYRLPPGYFKAKLPHRARAVSGVALAGVPAAEHQRLAWHLPDDSLSRPKTEQEEILDRVGRVIISGSTDYRRFQAAAMRQRYIVRFNRTEITDWRLDSGSLTTASKTELALPEKALSFCRMSNVCPSRPKELIARGEE